MELVKLTARLRTGTGKSYTRKARAAGWIPATYYGHNTANVTLEVDYREFATLVRNKKLHSFISLDMGTGEELTCLIKEVQKHVVKTEKVFNIDFQHFNLTEKVIAEVDVVLTGVENCAGVKTDGGMVNHTTHTVKVEALAQNLPAKIVVDVTDLRAGQVIHVRDIKTENFTIKDSGEEVIAAVTVLRGSATEEATA